MAYKAHDIEYNGYRIEIIQDEDACSPQEDGDCDDHFLIFDHRDFCVKVEGWNPQDVFDNYWSKGIRFVDGYHIFGVEAYIHGGVSLALKSSVKALNFPDRRWDVSFRGFIFIKRVKGWSWKREKAYTIAESVIKEWDQYLRGDVYGYVITKEGERIEDGSCWGYYGADYCLEEAKSLIDHLIKQAA